MSRLPLLAALLVAAPAAAQAPADVAKTAAPFIGEHTMVVARVDVTRVDVDAVVKLAALLSGEGDEIREAANAVRGHVKKFTAAGGTDVLVTYGPGDFPNLPALIAPV